MSKKALSKSVTHCAPDLSNVNLPLLSSFPSLATRVASASWWYQRNST